MNVYDEEIEYLCEKSEAIFYNNSSSNKSIYITKLPILVGGYYEL